MPDTSDWTTVDRHIRKINKVSINSSLLLQNHYINQLSVFPFLIMFCQNMKECSFNVTEKMRERGLNT